MEDEQKEKDCSGCNIAVYHPDTGNIFCSCRIFFAALLSGNKDQWNGCGNDERAAGQKADAG